MGFCARLTGSMEGFCIQFCNWEEAYAVAMYGASPATESLPCPSGANCFAESLIDSISGVRSGDLAYCLDSEATDPQGGLTTCSLVTNQLLSNPAQTCATAGFENGRCAMLQFLSGDVTNGSLVGVCMASQAPNRQVWELCDHSAGSADLCPQGSLCLRPDIFGADGLPARCVPYCDVAHPEGIQEHCALLGATPTADGTPICQSQSLLYPPGGPLDVMPTRLGLCAY